MITARFITKTINEAMWTANVKTKWSPPPGFFTQSAEKIAAGLKSASDSLKQAMARLNFYINRAGKNLKGDDRERLEQAKAILSKMYAKA